MEGKLGVFQCYQGWIFKNFVGESLDIFSNVDIYQCGTNSPVLDFPNESKSFNRNFKDGMTMREYKAQKLKSNL
jgi:hypothetical protein